MRLKAFFFGALSAVILLGQANAQSFTPTGGLQAAINAEIARAQSAETGPLAQPTSNAFWKSPTGSEVVNRIAGRALLGAATIDDGTFYPSGCAQCNGGNFTSLDWVGVLSRTLYNGAAGVGGDDTPWSQVVVLTDPNSQIASLAVPVSAFMAATESSHSKTNSTPRAANLFSFNNPTDATQHPTVWTSYLEAHRLVPAAGNTFGMEMEVRNTADNLAVGWTPYVTPGNGGTIGHAIGCGAGISATGMFDCSVAMYITANPKTFAAGIDFLAGSIGAYGPGGTKPAIEMPYDNAVQWYKSGSLLGGSINSDASGNLYLNETGTDVITNASMTVGDGALLKFGGINTTIGGSSTNGFMLFTAGGSERMRIASSGGVAIGTTTDGGAKLRVSGGVMMDALPTAGTGTKQPVCVDNTTGLLYKGTGASC